MGFVIGIMNEVNILYTIFLLHFPLWLSQKGYGIKIQLSTLTSLKTTSLSYSFEVLGQN